MITKSVNNSTEINRVKLLVCVKGEGVLGYSLFSSFKIIFAFFLLSATLTDII